MDDEKFNKTRDKFHARSMEEKAKERRAIFIDDLPHRLRSVHPQPILRTIVRPTIIQPVDTAPSTSAAAAARRRAATNSNNITTPLSAAGQNIPGHPTNDLTIVVDQFPQFNAPERARFAIVSPMRPTASNRISLDESIVSLSSESSNTPENNDLMSSPPLFEISVNTDEVPTPQRFEEVSIVEETTEPPRLYEPLFEYIQPNVIDDAPISPLWVITRDPDEHNNGVPSYTVTHAHQYEPYLDQVIIDESSESEPQSQPTVIPPPLLDVASPSMTTYVMSRQTSQQQATEVHSLQTSPTTTQQTKSSVELTSTTPSRISTQPLPPVMMSSCSNSPVPSLLQRTPSPATTGQENREQQPKRFFMSWEVEECQKPVLGNMRMVEGIARYRYFVERAPQNPLMPQPNNQTSTQPGEQGVSRNIDPSPKRKVTADTSLAVVPHDDGLPRTPICNLPSDFWERLPQIDISPTSVAGSSTPSHAPTPGIPAHWSGHRIYTQRNTPTGATLTRATLSLESLSISERDESLGEIKTTDHAAPLDTINNETIAQPSGVTLLNENNPINLLNTVIAEPVVPDVERWIRAQMQTHQVIEEPTNPRNVMGTEVDSQVRIPPEEVTEDNVIEPVLPDPELLDYLDIPVVYSSFEDLSNTNISLRETLDMGIEQKINIETNAAEANEGPIPTFDQQQSTEAPVVSFEIRGDELSSEDWEQLAPMIEEMRTQNARRTSAMLTLPNGNRYRIQLRQSWARVKRMGTKYKGPTTH